MPDIQFRLLSRNKTVRDEIASAYAVAAAGWKIMGMTSTAYKLGEFLHEEGLAESTLVQDDLGNPLVRDIYRIAGRDDRKAAALMAKIAGLAHFDKDFACQLVASLPAPQQRPAMSVTGSDPHAQP